MYVCMYAYVYGFMFNTYANVKTFLAHSYTILVGNHFLLIREKTFSIFFSYEYFVHL